MQQGFRIANLRIEKGLSQDDMARLLKVCKATYKKYEQNVSIIKLEELNLIANMFDVSLDYLLGLTSVPDYPKISNEIDYRYLRFSLKYHRRMQKINQLKMAKEFNVAPAVIRNYERFAHSMQVNYLVSFAKRFKISIDYICGKTLKKEIL